MTVLADTSVWVDFLALGLRGPGAGLSELLRDGQVVLCGPVVAELLAGQRGDRRDGLWNMLSGIPWLAMRPRGWRRAGVLAGDGRRQGLTLPPNDVQIAVIAIEHRVELWSRDRHFDDIARLAPDLRRFDPQAAV